jgi:hypothetical protein
MTRPIRSRLGLAFAAALTIVLVAACNPGGAGSTSAPVAPSAGGGSPAPVSTAPASAPASGAPGGSPADSTGGYTY